MEIWLGSDDEATAASTPMCSAAPLWITSCHDEEDLFSDGGDFFSQIAMI